MFHFIKQLVDVRTVLNRRILLERQGWHLEQLDALSHFAADQALGLIQAGLRLCQRLGSSAKMLK